MARKMSPLLCHISFILFFYLSVGNAFPDVGRKSYVVYMGDMRKYVIPKKSMHLEMIRNHVGRDYPVKDILHHFGRTFNGFVARLTDSEAKKISAISGVVSVFPNKKKQLHTTRSWDFLGFSQTVGRTTYETDVIIGVIDSGIWPESESFKDKGLGPTPTKWQGTCQYSQNFTCNKKIIGARYYRSDGEFPIDDFRSPRDDVGHGTHTSSTAAGQAVQTASLYGLAAGTARGAVPSARIAVYKVCWSDGCSDADILSAFDDAIADGVDIISISVGGNDVIDYFYDPIAIGSFHAMKDGILTSTSAGNSGPGLGTATNIAPWFISVAAITIDRKFLATILLGNNKTYKGLSINTDDLNNVMYPLIHGADAPARKVSSSISRYCLANTLDRKRVKGKIVMCDTVLAPSGPAQAGAVYRSNDLRDNAYSASMPQSHVSLADGTKIISYINSTRNATATIYKSRQTKGSSAPNVAEFSSRGPSLITLDLIKPDISAPGVDILAAWSRVAPVSQTLGDQRLVPYNIISGTSMACPHVTGVAAYVKSYHPTWSPSAIKSALMTTASGMSSKKTREAEFAFGAGHVNPLKAIDPGLVYDLEPIDYIKYLCGQGYDMYDLQQITGEFNRCSDTGSSNIWDLNYPSFGLSTFGNNTFVSRVFSRTLTNVGSPRSRYKGTVVPAVKGLKIRVTPKILNFSSVGQKLSFKLTIEGNISSLFSTSLVWTDGVHHVRSPITVFRLSS